MRRIKLNYRKITIIVILISLFVSMVASAQEQTSYGVRYNSNPNLRKQTEAHLAQFSLRGHHSSEGMGGGIAFSKIYNADKAVGFGWGTSLSATYHDKVGSLVDLAVKPTIKLGKSTQLRLSALVGGGSTAYTQLTQSPDGSAKHEYENSCWAFKAGGEVSLFIPFSETVGMELFGGYQHSFADPKNRETSPAEGWSQSTEYTSDSWYAGLGLAFAFEGHQVSGDWSWSGGAYGGYSFASTAKGVLLGAEAISFKRAGAYIVRVAGFGAEQLFGENEVKTNSVYGKIGIQIVPEGGDLSTGRGGVVFFETVAKIGVGEYYKTEGASTSDGRYAYSSAYYAIGAKASIEAGIGFRRGSWALVASGEFGGHVVGTTKFKGLNDVEYNGSTSKLSGSDAAFRVTLRKAF